MALRYECIEGDTAKPIEADLSDEDGPIVLLGAAIRFLMAPVPESGKTVPVVVGVAVAVNPNAVLGDPDLGKVRYQWADGDTDVPGVYRGQWEVTFANGTRETFPTGYNEIIIYERVAA